MIRNINKPKIWKVNNNRIPKENRNTKDYDPKMKMSKIPARDTNEIPKVIDKDRD